MILGPQSAISSTVFSEAIKLLVQKSLLVVLSPELPKRYVFIKYLK